MKSTSEWMLIILSACFSCLMLLLQERREAACRFFLPGAERKGGKGGKVLELDAEGILLSSNMDYIREAHELVPSAACEGQLS